MDAVIKGYVTDLKVPAQEVIGACHQLFEVERSFRVSESDLKARPIFHHTRDCIEAHLTIVFAALAIARRMQAATGLTIKRLVHKLAVFRAAMVSLNGKTYRIPPHVTDEASVILEQLGSRGCGR